jgi:hypothetical protein
MTDSTQERDEAVMLRRIAGDTLRDIADDYDLSIEGARIVSNRAIRRHTTEVLCSMWDAQRQGELLTLAIPDAAHPDQQMAVHYLDWLLRQLDGVARVKVHYRPTAEGHVCFALEDVNFNDTPQEVAQ